jgi:hypothetical protein
MVSTPNIIDIMSCALTLCLGLVMPRRQMMRLRFRTH